MKPDRSLSYYLWGALATALVGASIVQGQPTRQNPQIFIGTKTNVQVIEGTPVCSAISVNAQAGILLKIIVGGKDASASTSADFDVRITQKAGCVEDDDSIFQFETSSTIGEYPFGLYITPIIIFRNADSPATEKLYVLITNRDVGTTAYFDIFIAGQKLDWSGT